MLHCGSEQEGFNAFYRLLDEFQNRNKNLDINGLGEIAAEDKPQIKV